MYIILLKFRFFLYYFVDVTTKILCRMGKIFKDHHFMTIKIKAISLRIEIEKK